MNNNYYVIGGGIDGVWIHRLTEEELRVKLNQKYFGENVRFLSDIPSNSDRKSWWTFSIHDHGWPENSVLIIKGNPIVPAPKKVVTEYTLGED